MSLNRARAALFFLAVLAAMEPPSETEPEGAIVSKLRPERIYNAAKLTF